MEFRRVPPAYYAKTTSGTSYDTPSVVGVNSWYGERFKKEKPTEAGPATSASTKKETSEAASDQTSDEDVPSTSR